MILVHFVSIMVLCCLRVVLSFCFISSIIPRYTFMNINNSKKRAVNFFIVAALRFNQEEITFIYSDLNCKFFFTSSSFLKEFIDDEAITFFVEKLLPTKRDYQFSLS